MRKNSQKDINMKDKILLGIQVIAGLMLVVFGLNGFLQFIPMAQPAPEMGQYLGALFAAGFIFPIVSTVEILAGLAFLSNRFASLMAIILMPIMLNAFLSHIFLDMNGIGGSMFLVIATVLIMIRHKDRYVGVFRA